MADKPPVTPEELAEARALLWRSYLAFLKEMVPGADSAPSYVREFSEASNAFLNAIHQL